MPRFTEIAYAKINLALHVRSRRADGYHELESLVAFLNSGDVLSVEPAEQDRFSVDGAFAANSGDANDNLVLRTLAWARSLPTVDIPPLAIDLTKNLPVAAGLGGGSADAAALLRILCNKGFMHNIEEHASETARLGADVPACLFSRPLIMRGIGEVIDWIDDDTLDDWSAVLVNPGFPVPTGPVFKAWDQVDRGGLLGDTALEIALSGRNDLQAPAIAHCPAIGDVLAVLDATHPRLTRMSGSGATCFALYDDPEKAAFVENAIKRDYPAWWVKAGRLTQCR
jgi:4-diphosphocytidyl-2-C-methyl-D-erythritol kinase